MTDELRSQVLRSLRAWTGIHQKDAASAAEVAENTLLMAEKGRGCSDRTWTTMIDYYAKEHGLHWRGGAGPMAIIIEA